MDEILHDDDITPQKLELLHNENVLLRQELQMYIKDLASEIQEKESLQTKLIDNETKHESVRKEVYKYFDNLSVFVYFLIKLSRHSFQINEIVFLSLKTVCGYNFIITLSYKIA